MNEIRIDRTGQPDLIAASDGSLTVTVPIRIKRRGQRKPVTLPEQHTRSNRVAVQGAAGFGCAGAPRVRAVDVAKEELFMPRA